MIGVVFGGKSLSRKESGPVQLIGVSIDSGHKPPCRLTIRGVLGTEGFKQRRLFNVNAIDQGSGRKQHDDCEADPVSLLDSHCGKVEQHAGVRRMPHPPIDTSGAQDLRGMEGDVSAERRA